MNKLLRKRVWIGVLFLVAIMNAQNETSLEVTYPNNGSLIIAGGGALPEEIIKTFIDLAGGFDAPIVVVPTAAGLKEYDDNWGKIISDHGATNVVVLHTDSRKEANSKKFIKPLKNSTGVWFVGGRQWRLADSYLDTETEKAFWDVLNRGGVIGGTSAGATIQGSYMVRGDTKTNQIMMGDHEEGFAFLGNVAIDQHVLARNRQFDILSILEKKPHLLGIGIDESTAIVVKEGTFKVMGKSYVLMYDGTFWSREGTEYKTPMETNGRTFYFLEAGDRYDLKAKKVIDEKE